MSLILIRKHLSVKMTYFAATSSHGTFLVGRLFLELVWVPKEDDMVLGVGNGNFGRMGLEDQQCHC